MSEKSGYIFNGPLCSLENWRVDDDTLHLCLGQTSYKELLFSNYLHSRNEVEYSERFNANALGISLVLTTGDAQIVLIKRSETVGEGPGKLDVVGGHIHPDEHCLSGTPDPFLAMLTEAKEEINLHLQDEQLSCIGIITTVVTGKPELIFQAEVDLPFKDIAATAEQAQSTEIADVLAIPDDPGAVQDFMTQNSGQLSPSAHGALWLYTS